MRVTDGEQPVNAAVKRARAHSPFLKLQTEAFPSLTERMSKEPFPSVLAEARRAGEGADSVSAALRHERRALSLVLAIGDLAGLLSLEEVVGELSDFADRALETALNEALSSRAAEGEGRGFAIIALGKHGSRELNYSSDVDLLFLFDPSSLPLKLREEPGRAAVRIGQRVIELIQKRDGDGYVFRVDLRLRPSPEVTPIALPVDAAISYYESSALPWERAAFIRARIVAGDRELGRYFLDSIHSFVWRRSLDYGAVSDIQSITRRIRDHYAHGQVFGPGYDLKRGRGGIREIEFFAQIHQLIHGGREPSVRAPSTLRALAALQEAGRISAEDVGLLSGAYRLLRTIEHRLQMVDDKQTHVLPADPTALDNVAQLHGFRGAAELLDLLRYPVERVGAVYDALAGEDHDRLPRGAEALEAILAGLGFDDPAAARARIDSWRSGKARSLRASAAQEAFEAMLPALVRAFAQSPDPARAMNRFDDLVVRMPSGLNFYRLLEARPGLADVVATILSHAPALADQLARRPVLLDGLINQSAFEPPPTVPDLAAEFARPDRADEDYQTTLDRVRRRVNERRFALGTQLVMARSDPVEVAAGYARVAEAAIRTLAEAAIAEFQAAHGRVPGSELLILGLGRLGGEGLTHASDLDLVYLFTGTHEAASDGAKPLRATDYFNRLAKRVGAALSVPTAAGPLYDVDTRLRPSGANGLLAVSLESFESYQRGSAWTWEHMALTRARPVFGSEAAMAAAREVIQAILSSPRDPKKLIGDAVQMRADMARHKPPAGPLDIKLGQGGLVDLEFAVHCLQLRHRTALQPRLERAIAELIEQDLVPAGIAEAHFLLARMLITLRLISPESQVPPEPSRDLVARACGHGDWNALLAAHDAARQRVSDLWRSVAASGGETK